MLLAPVFDAHGPGPTRDRASSSLRRIDPWHRSDSAVSCAPSPGARPSTAWRPTASPRRSRELERAQPALRGWILDERGAIRRHINVFVNGEYADRDTPLTADDRVEVIPAISGGRDRTMTELLVGTKKGLFVLDGEGGEFAVRSRAFAGEPVDYAMRDPARAASSRR